MATINQIRGMLLEEAILFLLRQSGYITIESADDDVTLQMGSAGMEVKGRGGVHQIDAIADFVVNPPFSFPLRLLLEAKFHKSKPTGIGVIRNAVGVQRDVEEFWVTLGEDISGKRRFHYQYAVFSSTGYSVFAERFAFAHDIYLLPLQDSRFIQPIIGAISKIGYEILGATSANKVQINMYQTRIAVRNALLAKKFYFLEGFENQPELRPFGDFLDKCIKINAAVIGMIQRELPVFLVPSPETIIHELKNYYKVRIHYDNEGWWTMTDGEGVAFSFDLPGKIFNLYNKSGYLSPKRKLMLNEGELSFIQVVIVSPEDLSTKVITFELSPDWIDSVEQGLSTRAIKKQQ